MKNDHTPEIRFPTFNDVWTQRTLNSVADRLKSYSLSRDVETKEFTGYKYIHYGDIHTKVAEIVDKNTNLPNIKPGKYELLEKGDLVLADASEDYQGIAAPAVITENVSYKLVAGLHTIALRPKNIDSLFLYYLLNSPTFKRYGYKTGTGMKVFGISVTNLMKFESMFPLLEEQIKIGDFLRKIDKTIDLHQQELNTLKQTKQGFLQKMFPKEGESVPELRFPRFTDDWEKSKIGKITDSFSGGTPSANKKEYYGGSIPFIRSGEINSETTELSLSEEGLKNSSAKLVNKGDILYAMYGATSGEVSISKINGAINQAILALKPKDKYDGNFITQWLIRQKMSIVNTFLQGGQGNLSGTLVKEIYIPIPVSKEEQIQIGTFFKQLDEVIALHQQELNALKQTKKAFLQKMFV